MFRVGDKIVHPMHGAGVVDEIVTRKVDGVLRDYYSLKLPIGGMQVMIPTDHCGEIGVRSILSGAETEWVLGQIPSLRVEMDPNWNHRYRTNMERLKSGNLLEVAKVVKGLMGREAKRGLSTGERKMPMPPGRFSPRRSVWPSPSAIKRQRTALNGPSIHRMATENGTIPRRKRKRSRHGSFFAEGGNPMAFLRTLFHREREPAPLCSAVIVAAGRASRMEGIDKILTPMGGQPLLLYTLAPFQACEQVGEIVIVTREDLMVPIGTLCSQHGLTKVRRVVKGGESRTESVLAGLGETDPQAALVAIHDGARPFLPEAVLEEAIQAAAQHGAAAPAIPVKDTIKVAQAGVVQSTPDRGQLFAVQTPQVFDRALLQEALGQAAAEGLSLTDDRAAVERLGRPVYLTRAVRTT